MACAGDVPTLETLAAVDLLRQHLPDLKVRVVNVVDLMTLQPRDFFLFHADDVRLQRRRPWFNHKLANPLGAFIARWPQRLRVILPSRVTNLRKVS